MNSTTNETRWRISGTRRKACCGRLAGCACRGPVVTGTTGTASIPDHFSGNFSAMQGVYHFFGFNKCRVSNCKIKCLENNMVLPLNNFRSSVNGRHYPILTDSNLNCQSVNIIYLITCNVCKTQYVGETQRSFGIRMREHLNQIRKCERDFGSGSTNGDQLIYKHFCSDSHHRDVPLEKRVRFQIIEKIKSDDLGSDQKAITRRRTDRELYWISKLRTAFPLGLNVMISGFGIRGKATDPGFVDYNHLRIANLCDQAPTRSRNNRHRCKRRKAPSTGDFDTFFSALSAINQSDSSKLESLIMSKSRKFLTRFLTSPISSRLSKKVRYHIEARVNFVRKVKPVKKEVNPVDWVLDYSHKIFDKININSLIKDPNLSKLLPNSIKKSLKIRKIFKFRKPDSCRILNYNRVLRDAGNLSYDEICAMSCDCVSSEFKHDHFNHVITGDCNIIQEPGLRKLCSLGTKFRDTPHFNLSSIRKGFEGNLKSLVVKLSKKFKVPLSSLKDWRNYFSKSFCSKLYFYAGQQFFKSPILSNINSINELKRLQERFVITVVDKASGNYAFTCKKFYFLKLAEELGLQNATPGNDTYLYCADSEQTVCSRLQDELKKFRVNPLVNHSKLALLYQIPKFHKNPPKMRYIAGNVGTVTSPLDEKVAIILKMCKSHFRNLCKVYERHSGVRHCFDVETSAEVKDMFDGAAGEASNISINDFSTLYTLFDHDHLLKNMKWLLDTLSKNSGKNCIKVDFKSARWVTSANEADAFTICEILDMISTLIKGTFIKAFGHIFQQVKGIIMGGKISGWLSDCSLMVDEFLFVRDLISGNLRDEALRLKYFRRYRDDCTTLNCPDFIDVAQRIYPPSLTLTQENDNPSCANVLDMEVTISDSACLTRVYCKTDHFPFSVISFPFLDSNIDDDLCYRVFYSQIIRFQRLCTFRNDFELRVLHLGKVLLERGYFIRRLERMFCRAIDKYAREFQKWSLPMDIRGWFTDIFPGDFRVDPGGNLVAPPMSFSQPTVGLNIHESARTTNSQP